MPLECLESLLIFRVSRCPLLHPKKKAVNIEKKKPVPCLFSILKVI